MAGTTCGGSSFTSMGAGSMEVVLSAVVEVGVMDRGVSLVVLVGCAGTSDVSDVAFADVAAADVSAVAAAVVG